jgi:Uma2 family endonuclease
MGVGTLISEEEYLHTGYDPDCGFEDGLLIERNVGTEPHSWLQIALGAFFFRRRKAWGITAYTEQRIRLRAGKYMIPDVCVVKGPRPKERVLTSAPLLVIEILSPEDRPVRVNKTVQAWRDFGVAYVWVIDPETLENELYDERGRSELPDGILRIPGTPIEVPLRLLDEDE